MSYAWSKWLRDKEGKAIFVGKGNVLERLLSHRYSQNPTDAAIWSNRPHTFRFELTDNLDQRAACGVGGNETARKSGFCPWRTS